MRKSAHKKLVREYLAENCPSPERLRLEEHFRGCPVCRRELAAYRELDRRVRNLVALPAGPAYEDKFQRRLAARLRSRAGKTAYPLRLSWPARPGLFGLPRGVLAGTALAAALAAVLLLTLPGPGPELLISRVEGEAGLYRGREARFAAARVRTRLEPGDLLETGAGGRVFLIREGEYEIRAGSGARLVCRGRGKYELRRGKAAVRTLPGFSGAELAFITPAARAVVRGTIFTLEAGPDGASELRVGRGTVELAGLGDTPAIPVKAGFRSSVRPGRPPDPPVRMSPGDLRVVLGEFDELGVDGPIPGQPAESMEGSVTLVLPETGDRIAALLEEGPPVIYAAAAGAALIDRLKTITGFLDRGRPETAAGELEKLLSTGQLAAPSERALRIYLGAVCYRLLDRENRAYSIFDEISRSGNRADAALAELAKAHILKERLVGVLAGIRERFPASPEAVGAAKMLDELAVVPERPPADVGPLAPLEVTYRVRIGGALELLLANERGRRVETNRLPPGASLEAETRTLSWRPEKSQAGWWFGILVTSSRSLSGPPGTRFISIVVDPADSGEGSRDPSDSPGGSTSAREGGSPSSAREDGKPDGEPGPEEARPGGKPVTSSFGESSEPHLLPTPPVMDADFTAESFPDDGVGDQGMISPTPGPEATPGPASPTPAASPAVTPTPAPLVQVLKVTTGRDEEDPETDPENPLGIGLSLREAVALADTSQHSAALIYFHLSDGGYGVELERPLVLNKDFVSIDGIPDFESFPFDPRKIEILRDGSGVDQAIIIEGSGNELSDLIFSGYSSSAVVLGDRASGNTVAKCVFSGNNNGIVLSAGCFDTAIKDNSYQANSGADILIYAASSAPFPNWFPDWEYRGLELVITSGGLALGGWPKEATRGDFFVNGWVHTGMRLLASVISGNPEDPVEGMSLPSFTPRRILQVNDPADLEMAAEPSGLTLRQALSEALSGDRISLSSLPDKERLACQPLFCRTDTISIEGDGRTLCPADYNLLYLENGLLNIESSNVIVDGLEFSDCPGPAILMTGGRNNLLGPDLRVTPESGGYGLDPEQIILRDAAMNSISERSIQSLSVIFPSRSAALGLKFLPAE